MDDKYTWGAVHRAHHSYEQFSLTILKYRDITGLSKEEEN